MPSQVGFNAACYANRYPDLKHRMWVIRSDKFFGYSDNPITSHAWAEAGAMAAKNAGKPFNLLNLGIPYQFPTDLEKHFKEVGKYQNRVAGCDIAGTVYAKEFNTAAYIARYPDVVNDINFRNDPYAHYVQIGFNQNRIPGYEILNENSPAGMEASNTTQFVSLNNPKAAPITTNNPNITTKQGDGMVVNPPLSDIPGVPTQGDGTVYTPPVTPGTNANVTTNILAANPLLIAAGAGLLLILLLKKRKKTKR